MSEFSGRKLSRRKLLGGAAGTAAALPLLHELVPHQGVHDQLASAQGSAGTSGKHGKTMRRHQGIDPPGDGRAGRPARQRLRPHRDAARLRPRGRQARGRAHRPRVRARGGGQGDRGGARASSTPHGPTTAACPGPTLRATEGERVRVKFVNASKPSPHDPLPRHPPRPERRRAGRRARQHRVRRVLHLRVRRRCPSASTSTTATPPRWPTTSRRGSTARSSSIPRRAGRRPTSW